MVDEWKKFEKYICSKYNLHLNTGFNSQAFFSDTKEGVEIKYNSKTGKGNTGIWCEIYERRHPWGNWALTGWVKNSYTQWLIAGNFDYYFLLSKNSLIKYLMEYKPYLSIANSKTSFGFSINFEELIKICIKYVIKDEIRLGEDSFHILYNYKIYLKHFINENKLINYNIYKNIRF